MEVSKKTDTDYGKGKGLFLFICNLYFGKEGKNESVHEGRFRKGGVLDVSSIAPAVALLDVEYKLHENKRAEEILEIIDGVKDMMEKNLYHSLFLVISTHGAKGTIVGTDEVSIDVEEQIIKPLHNYQCSGLRGKPKIFILNCCRGNMDPDAIPREGMSRDDAPPSRTRAVSKFKTKKVEEIDTVPKIGDYMVVYSTPKDVSSYRFYEKGSPLLQTLSSRIIKLAEDKALSHTSLQVLVTKVQQQIITEFGLQIVVEGGLSKDFFLPIKGKHNKNT